MNSDIIELSSEIVDYLATLGDVELNKSLAHYTTFKTGGPADIILHPSDKISLSHAVAAVREQDIPLTIIGGGSNLLVGDRGVRGLVIMMSDEGRESEGKLELKNNGIIYSDASVSKERFIDYSIDMGFEGPEFMAGVPGAIGGGIMMNAGTYMGTFADYLVRVEIIDANCELKSVDVGREMSSYRKFDVVSGSIITGGYFKFSETDDIKKMKSSVRDILEDRKSKHPLEFPSAGSVFKNPQGHSSWQLVDGAGLKGKRIGGAMVSEKHTNFVINYENATTNDIRSLIELIQGSVYEKFQVNLETEIRMIGEF